MANDLQTMKLTRTPCICSFTHNQKYSSWFA